jgi:hypothetical protein
MISRLQLALLLGCLSTPLLAQATRQGFGPDTFNLQLPAGYALLGAASPGPGMKAFGFATSPRADGSRGLIQVTLIRLDSVPSADTVTVDQLAASMISGVRQRRSNWQEADSAVTVDGVSSRLISWSGTNEPSPERPSGSPVLAMRGVMIVGVKAGVAFALHAQDVEPFASNALAASEAALKTFALVQRR